MMINDMISHKQLLHHSDSIGKMVDGVVEKHLCEPGQDGPPRVRQIQDPVVHGDGGQQGVRTGQQQP